MIKGLFLLSQIYIPSSQPNLTLEVMMMMRVKMTEINKMMLMTMLMMMLMMLMMMLMMLMMMPMMQSICFGMIERSQVVSDGPSVENSSFLARLPILPSKPPRR